jgi:hypothetical protein
MDGRLGIYSFKISIYNLKISMRKVSRYLSYLLFFLFPIITSAQQSPSDPLLKNKTDELARVNKELDYWQKTVPNEIGQLERQLGRLQKLQQEEKWKFPDPKNPPKQFPEIPQLEKDIAAKEKQASEKTKELIEHKARLEMSIQVHDDGRWKELHRRFNAGDCTPEEIQSAVSGKDQFYIKKIFGPPEFAGDTKIWGRIKEYDVLVFKYAGKIKNKYTEKTEDLFLYFYGDGNNKKCIGRKLESDSTVTIWGE